MYHLSFVCYTTMASFLFQLEGDQSITFDSGASPVANGDVTPGKKAGEEGEEDEERLIKKVVELKVCTF